VFGRAGALFYYSNRLGSGRCLSPGIHGLSNDSLDSSWPKVVRGKERLARIVNQGKAIAFEDLLDVLSDQSRPQDELLPDTGVGLDKERMLSPIFIASPDYGTRCSTIMLIDQDGWVEFLEKTHDPPGQKKGAPAGGAPEVHFRFQLQPS
jgi:uncharacterized protein with NRDE domain